jgi:DNA-binding transcriptional LysR family regulator
MRAMREVHLRQVDLNLLHALRALLEERHVTRAAARCFLSQPAMSRSLERLREMFGDVLLVRSGRSYQRTVRGERVLLELETLMPRLQAMVSGEDFDPARSRERFRLAMTDHASMVLMPPDTREGQQTPVDRCLAELGLKRRAGLHLPFFVPTILTIARTDLILTLPRRLAKIIARIADVRVVEPPREIKGFSYFMVWHPRLTAEPAHVWFREQLRGAARKI